MDARISRFMLALRPRIRFIFLSAALLLVCALSVCATSVLTGPSFAEVERMDTVDAAKALILGVSERGPSALTARDAAALYDRAAPYGILSVLTSAWALLAVGPDAADALTLYRFGWLGLTASAPMALFWFAEPSYGVWVGLLGAALLLVSPSWLHAASVGSPGAVVGAFWVLLAATYVRSLRGDRRVCWAITFAALLGVALACNRSTAWIVAPIVVHFAALRRASLRTTIRSGRVPLPAGLLFALFVSPVVLVAVSPSLWRPGVRVVLEWLLRPLREVSVRLLYLGHVVDGSYEAPTYAVHWVLVSTPLLSLIFAAVGSFTLVRRRSRARDHRDPRGLALLAFTVLVFGLLVLPLMPNLVAPFPAPAIGVVPFLAFFSAVGLDRVATQTMPQQKRWFASAVTVLLAALWLRDLPTIGAFYNSFAGGVGGVSKNKTFDVGDGSEVAVLAPRIDAVGKGSVEVMSPDVPAGYFDALRETNRMQTRVQSASRHGRADLKVLRGRHIPAIAEAKRDDVPLWTLTAGG